LLNNKLNLILNFLDESEAKQTLYNQNCEYIKEEVTRLTQCIDSLKGKPNTESIDKEIVLSSSGLVTASRTINSERWIYLRALPESKKLQLVNHDLKPLTLMDQLKGKSEDIDNLE
jgi:hypothetical protein